MINYDNKMVSAPTYVLIVRLPCLPYLAICTQMHTFNSSTWYFEVVKCEIGAAQTKN